MVFSVNSAGIKWTWPLLHTIYTNLESPRIYYRRNTSWRGVGEDFLNRTHKALVIEEKIDKLVYSKLKTKQNCIKGVQRQTRREPMNWGRVFIHSV